MTLKEQTSRESTSDVSFQLVAGHPALDFVNTLDDRPTTPKDLLNTYDDLLRFLAESELLTDRQAKKLKRLEATPSERAQILQQVKLLRESLAAVAYAQLESKPVPEASLETLGNFFKKAAAHRHLEIEDSQLIWAWKGISRQLASPLLLLAQSAADLLLSDQAAHLRSCSSDTCRWLFLDTSKNHTRRWCDMKVCGNRMKARRFQARQAASA